MYAFVLEWTPAVGSSSGKPPLGIIFAAFMVRPRMRNARLFNPPPHDPHPKTLRPRSSRTDCASQVAFMMGSTIVSFLLRTHRAMSPATILVALTATALVALLSAFFLLATSPAGDEKPPVVAVWIYLCLCIFEGCLGACERSPLTPTAIRAHRPKARIAARSSIPMRASQMID